MQPDNFFKTNINYDLNRLNEGMCQKEKYYGKKINCQRCFDSSENRETIKVDIL